MAMLLLHQSRMIPIPKMMWNVEALLAAVGYDPVSVDEIVARTNLTTQAISSMLVELELQGRVMALGGGRYSRTGNDQETN